MLSRNGLIVLLGIILILSIGSCKKDEVDQEALDQELIEAYIDENNLTTTKTASGLHYIIGSSGDDNHPNYYSFIVATYEGYLLDGSVFDDGSMQLESNLGQLIPGWIEGLPYIGEGGKIKLIIPSNLGYGGMEKDGIPEYSVLVFDINLLQVYE
jgi:FKBP-type peptidyl-prolyl cis-trans isomerase FkpA